MYPVLPALDANKPVLPIDSSFPDRKFSVVIFGISECPQGTSKFDCSDSGFNVVCSVISGLDSSIQQSSIRDSHRLGKFSPSTEHPHHRLVKLNRATDVAKILSKRSSLARGIYISF